VWTVRPYMFSAASLLVSNKDAEVGGFWDSEGGNFPNLSGTEAIVTPSTAADLCTLFVKPCELEGNISLTSA